MLLRSSQVNGSGPGEGIAVQWTRLISEIQGATIKRAEQQNEYSNDAQIARDYYNSSDADTFYSTVWGGTDIHVGLYRGIEGLSDTDDIATASARTVERISAGLTLDGSTRVLDLGSGYGGSARHLAKAYGSHVTCLNLSEVENDYNRKRNQQEGVEHLVDVLEGTFEDLPFQDGTFDVVWSQDALVHSGDRDRVLSEAARVLVSGGEFVFTDLLAADHTPVDTLGPILERLHLSSMGTPTYYREATARVGLTALGFEDLSAQLPIHYARVLEETERRETELLERISADYLERMKVGLREWVARGRAGDLVWGIHHYQR